MRKGQQSAELVIITGMSGSGKASVLKACQVLAELLPLHDEYGTPLIMRRRLNLPVEEEICETGHSGIRDQERVRGNLQRLGQTPEEATLRQRYIRQLEQQENRLGALRAERDRLDNARAQAQKQLDQMLQNLTLDRKL